MAPGEHDIRAQWERIDAWMRSHGARPVECRPAADPEQLESLADELGIDLPADLRAWWSLAGLCRDNWIPVAFAPETWADALEMREIQLQVADDEDWSDPGMDARMRFDPAFLPIGMSPGGDSLIVDLRADAGQFGAVLFWDHETWKLDVPLWESVGAMLRDAAQALETRSRVLLGHAARGGSAEEPSFGYVAADGWLTWEPELPPAP
ncbi:SMI1/KNR4 family protein [Yinghuangia soli]|uniref:SMI1/KNR4 family protein n=1 Tax=Yinghuangia soli TaxID=2908204 RepID=A0AA41U4K2_9ACTN|nr:SMI1/KNR4 family protein [Yinghuangia soli]MCF2533010.1 SMI1/KNR4 family protein [Yinghuangia soli]